jgi:anthranilate phosphoribosyltransferase
MGMEIGKIISTLHKIIEKENLTSEEIKEAFTTIIREDREGYFLLAFFTALSTKGETAEELYGLCQSLSRFCPELNIEIDPNIVTDLSGTGGAKLKTINVSTAASFIVAATGIKVAKQAFPGITSPTGSADVFQNFGIDIFNVNRDILKKCLHKVGIVPYNVVFGLAKGIDNLRNFGRLQFEKGLAIRTPMHLIANIFSPIKMKRRIYGMFNEKYLFVTAELLQKLGYTKGVVFYGLDGLCEISNIGQTKVVEFDRTKIEEYTIEPKDFGIKRAKYEDIKAINPEQNIIDFLKVISGKEKGPKADMVFLNAAASLYVLEKSKDIKEGIDIAKNLVKEGKPLQKLTDLVSLIGNKEMLEEWKEKAGIGGR